MSRPPANLAGELLQRGYVLLGKLARGETSTIYEAQHEVARRRLAIKVTAADAPDAERNAGRLLTAWNVVRGLRHPHLVSVIDAGRLSDGRGWMAMERLRGRDLQIELDEVGRLPPARAVHVMRQVCEGLQVLHRRGAVHRDVEPKNIYLSSAGHFADHVKLIDLGRVAVGEDAPQRAHAPTGPFLIGTPLYLPPELARGETATPAADFYAFGAVLYHLLAGRPPYFDPVPTRLIAKHVNEPIPPLPEAAGAPPELAALVTQCLGKEPEFRPPSAEPVLAALDACLARIGGAPAEIESRGPELPPVPPAGVAPEWARFADHLRRIVRGRYGRVDAAPPAVGEALAWVTSARSLLEQKIADAERQRAHADTGARDRIERRQGLEERLTQLDAALEKADVRLREAEHTIFTAVRAREKLDERIRDDLRNVEVAAGGVRVGPRDLAPLIADFRGRLAIRADLDAQVIAGRQAERAAAESMALLMAERLEMLRAHADVELEEQDEGQRAEWIAARGADEALTAQRAFENACLNLYLRCVEILDPDASS